MCSLRISISMKFITTLLTIFLLSSLPVYAQYNPLEVNGDIPEEFYQSSTEKYKLEVDNMDSDLNGREKRTQKKFFLESNFVIDDLLQSGYVLFNDPISDYIQEVANIILKEEPELQRKLQFYVVRSSAVNAFAINQGIIFVNMGLLSQLENEAQLAFVLAHEISHYVKKHGLEFYIEKKGIENSNQKELLERTDYNNKILAINQFSREQETEADALGLELFMKTDFSTEAVDGVFDVLQYARLPFDEVPFDKSFFEDDYLQFPAEYHLKKTTPIETEVSDNDEESTHPSIPKRRILVKENTQKSSNTGKDFLLSSERFRTTQKQARQELLAYNLRDHNYFRAIYNAYLLLKKEPNNLYYQKAIGKALYGLAKVYNVEEIKNNEFLIYEIEGEISRLFYLFKTMSVEELNVLAFRYNYLLYQKNTKNEGVRLLLNSLAEDLVLHHPEQLVLMKSGVPKEAEASSETPENIDEPKTKLDKIRAKTVSNTDVTIYAFGDFITEPTYKTIIENARAANKTQTVKSKEAENSFWGDSFASKRKTSKNIHALDLNKVLVLNPFYKKFNYKFREENYIKSEKAQTYFQSILAKNAAVADLDLVMLDGNSLNGGKSEEFNEIRHLNEWLEEQFYYDQPIEQIAFNQQTIDAIAEKYDVEAVLLTGVLTGKVEKGSEMWAMLLYSPPTFLYELFTPKGETAIFSVVLDLKTGEVLMDTFDHVGNTDDKDILNQRAYEIMWQISRKAKKK
ncbi:MAG: hypothetical protein ACJAVF_000177 [Paraglaciecola sp.]|jgi:hypothetical protein